MVRGLFLADARIEGRTAGPFAIDSGATRIVLDVALAKELSLPLARESVAPGTQLQFHESTVAALEVGPLTFRGTEVAVTDLSAMSGAIGERLAGILGYPFFARAVVEVDYAARTITCFDPKTYRLTRGDWLPLSFHNNRPVLRAHLEGNIQGQFLLDTGSNGTVILHAPFVQAHGLLDGRTTSTMRSVWLSGAYESRLGTLAWFEVAGRRFDGLRVEFAPATIRTPASQELAGIIGQGLLRHFTVVFNLSEVSIALLRK
jgi:predicted aspartyl protease